MILKKRDIYFLLILLSLVGYAVCHRIFDDAKSNGAQAKTIPSVADETVSMFQTTEKNDTAVPVLR